MKVFGGQTKTEISPGQTCLNLQGKMVISVLKISKYQFFVYISFVENQTVYCHNFYAFFGFKKPKKTRKKQICVVTPVVIALIFFYNYLQYLLKQKCTRNLNQMVQKALNTILKTVIHLSHLYSL